MLAILGLSLFYSCNSMNNEPTDSYTDSKFWTSADKAQYVLNMAYNQLYSASKMWSDECLSDNLFEGRSYTDQRMIRDGIADPSTGIFSSEWSDLYSGIKTCHVFSDKIGLVTMDETKKANMIAQIRFIRASLFFRLSNFYGAIPFFTKDITLDESKTVSRTDRSTVITFIHSELDDIMKDLPKKDDLSADERGKITKGAACMLQARAYLYDNDWSNVEKYCNYLMNDQANYGTYSLFNSYSGLFLQDNEYNSEIIMDCSYVPATRTWTEMYDMAPLSVGARINSKAPTQSLVDSYLTLDGETIDQSSTYDESNPYVNRDPRLTATVVYDNYDWSGNVNDGTTKKIIYIKPNSTITTDAYSGSNANQTSTGYYVRKYYDPKHEASLASAINIITMRYADVLLMYAEAMNEQGKMTEDIWNKTIEPIRARAGFTSSSALNYPSNVSQEQMREIIRRERRCELALEGLRWYDIKRWKAGTTYLNGYVYGAKFAENGSYIRLDNRKFIESRDYLWSVPQSQMDINSNLKPNNSGYAN